VRELHLNCAPAAGLVTLLGKEEQALAVALAFPKLPNLAPFRRVAVWQTKKGEAFPVWQTKKAGDDFCLRPLRH
jgi:hypothetical protein